MKRAVTKISDVKIKNKLKSWIHEAYEHPDVWNAGKEWYSEAQDFVFSTALDFGFKNYDVACIVAILSPNNKWERNKIDAETVIKAHINGIDPDSADTIDNPKIEKASNSGELIFIKIGRSTGMVKPRRKAPHNPPIREAA